MAINQGLITLIKSALKAETVSVSKLNQDTKGVLEGLAKEGKQRPPGADPTGSTVVTYRNEPAFLLIPIKESPEYLQAMAEHAASQLADWDNA